MNNVETPLIILAWSPFILRGPESAKEHNLTGPQLQQGEFQYQWMPTAGMTCDKLHILTYFSFSPCKLCNSTFPVM